VPWLCCGLYYVSIPLVLVAVLVLGAGTIYLILKGGLMGVGARVIVVVGLVTIVSAWSIVRSLFIQRREGDPGERLDLARHPKLRALLDEVAGRIGTRPVDNVYLTPGTEIAVMERAGLGGQMRGRAERCLILGVGGSRACRSGGSSRCSRTNTGTSRTATPRAAASRSPFASHF
jgi:hypothetical protein